MDPVPRSSIGTGATGSQPTRILPDNAVMVKDSLTQIAPAISRPTATARRLVDASVSAA